MKPTDSSEAGQDRVGEDGALSAGLAVAPVIVPAAGHGESGDTSTVPSPIRSVSGVVAAPRGPTELEEAHTTVDAGPARRFEESQAALSGRIRHAMDRTLPLGTPTPDASLFAEARAQRAAHARTIQLGGKLTGLGAFPPEPEPPTRRAEPPLSQDVATPRALEVASTQRMPPGYAGHLTPTAPEAAPRSPAAPAAAPRSAAPPEAALRSTLASARAPGVSEPVQRSVGASEPAPREGALRASFVRPVGLPTVPPPRRRRTLPPGATGFGDELDHEAFALDRPRASSLPPATALPGRGPTPAAAFSGTAARAARSTGVGRSAAGLPDARSPLSSALSSSVILPPPPQAGDYELSSSPSSAPPPLALAATARASSPSAGAAPAPVPTARPAARPNVLDLPSADPLAGYEAPQETWWQRSLIVFVVALAVVGLFALGAIAFGYLGTTGW